MKKEKKRNRIASGSWKLWDLQTEEGKEKGKGKRAREWNEREEKVHCTPNDKRDEASLAACGSLA